MTKRVPNSNSLREAAYKARSKSLEASGIKEINTGIVKKKTANGKNRMYPDMEHTKIEYPRGDTAIMPERYPDEDFESYLHRVGTGAL